MDSAFSLPENRDHDFPHQTTVMSPASVVGDVVGITIWAYFRPYVASFPLFGSCLTPSNAERKVTQIPDTYNRKG